MKPSRKSKSTRAYATAGAAALASAAGLAAASTPYTADPTATTASSEGPPATAQRSIRPAYSSLAAAVGAPPRARIVAAAARSDASVSSPVDAIAATAGAAAVAVAMAGKTGGGLRGGLGKEGKQRGGDRTMVGGGGSSQAGDRGDGGGTTAGMGRRRKESVGVAAAAAPGGRGIKAGRSSQAARVEVAGSVGRLRGEGGCAPVRAAASACLRVCRGRRGAANCCAWGRGSVRASGGSPRRRCLSNPPGQSLARRGTMTRRFTKRSNSKMIRTLHECRSRRETA